MLTKIVAKLKTGTIKNVVPFGTKLPAPPYVVVKPEIVPGTGRRFRVIAHRLQGEQSQLEDYVREAIALLDEFQATSRTGKLNALGNVESITDIGAVSDDSTISMEAAFIMPTHTF
jgi:hypothetical protein